MGDTVHLTFTAPLLLGAFHGINPGMGWLFAVALGMQERRRQAVWRALLPLGLGHLLAIAIVLALALAASLVVPQQAVQWTAGLALAAFGLRRLVRPHHRHPGAGMRVGFGGLTLWSFLMATAHGAGLMMLPVVLAGSGVTPAQAALHAAHAGHAAHVAAAPGALASLTPTLVHGAGYLAVTALVATLVYEKLGVGLLRKTWLNIDLVWAVALIVSGLVTIAL